MDFARSVEALIPGARGRVLGALARVERELTLRAVAELAHTSPTQTSRVLADLVHLGVVGRRDVPPAALFWLVGGNAAAQLVKELERLDEIVVERLRSEARRLTPQPLSMMLFGSFARGEADSDSDIDVLVVPPGEVDDDQWINAMDSWTDEARAVSGNPVRILEVGAHELADHFGEPRGVWRSIVEDGVHLTGTPIRDLEGIGAT